MIPARRACSIPPVKVEIEKITAEAKNIPPKVTTQKKAVFIAQLEVDFRIQVIEEIVRDG